MSKLLALMTLVAFAGGCEGCPGREAKRAAPRKECDAHRPSMPMELRPCYEPPFIDLSTCRSYHRAKTHVEGARGVLNVRYKPGLIFVGKRCMRDPACYELLWSRLEVARQVSGVVIEFGAHGQEEGLRSYGAMLRRVRGGPASHLRFLALCDLYDADRLHALGRLPVRVKEMDLPSGKALSHIAAAPGLERLHVVDLDFDDCDARQLLRFSALRAFILYGPHSRLTGQGASALVQMPRMHELTLTGAMLRWMGRQAQRRGVQIRRLRLDNTLLGDGFCSLLHRAPIERLTLRADWRRCPKEGRRLSPTCWSAVQSLSALRRLDLSGRALKGLDFSGLEKLRQLRRIDIVSAQLSDEQIVAIASLPRLERLDLSNVFSLVGSPPRNTVGVRSLKALGLAQRLKWLGVAGMQLRDQHMRLIARIESLKHLRISNNPKLTARGLRSLRALRQLESIDVDRRLEKATRRLLPKVKQPDASWVK
jgi:hypothetical protein